MIHWKYFWNIHMTLRTLLVFRWHDLAFVLSISRARKLKWITISVTLWRWQCKNWKPPGDTQMSWTSYVREWHIQTDVLQTAAVRHHPHSQHRLLCLIQVSVIIIISSSSSSSSNNNNNNNNSNSTNKATSTNKVEQSNNVINVDRTETKIIIVTRLPSSLRPTTRKCVHLLHLVMINSVAENPRAARKLHGWCVFYRTGVIADPSFALWE